MPQDTQTNVQLAFDGALTMRTVDDVRATLRAAIEPPADAAPEGFVPPGISIDCSAADEIDLTFIQLLIAARLSGRACGRSLQFAPEPNGVLLDTLTRGGFRVVPEPGAGFWFTGDAA
jgi:hypothetical protein